MIPILLRTRNRAGYLHTTLKSLMATDLLDAKVIIADDCSDDFEMNEYLFGSSMMKLKFEGWKDQITNHKMEKQIKITHSKMEDLTNLEIWEKYIGDIPNEQYVKQLGKSFTVIQPKTNLGDKTGLYWTINAGFSLFGGAEKIIIIEDDLIFHKDWLKVANFIYDKEKLSECGLVSVYNRENDTINDDAMYENIDYVGGVMYLIPRKVFNLLEKSNKLNQKFTGDQNLGGDVDLQNFVKDCGLKILNSTTSYIQHIGISSLCRPGRFLRYSKNFLQPYAWDKNFDK